MHYRVTSSSYAQRAIHYSAMHSSKVLQYQQQIASGLRFERPSEEPISFRQLTSLRTRFSELEADRAAIDRASSVLNASVSQIQEFSTVIKRAKVLTQQGIQALDDDERNALALEVDGLLNQLKGLGLAQFNDKYLYGGTQSEAPPFEFSEPTIAGRTLDVAYRGSSQRSRASVGDSIAVDTYYSGLEIYGSGGREDTILIGNTGAKTGTGTDTMVGRGTLHVLHNATTYLGSSGVLPGSSSGSEDTIIGPAGTHKLTIVDTAGDGSSGTIALNDGAPVSFTGSDSNLRVEGLAGQVVYVDTTNITAGFNGTIDVASSGTLSVDGGETEIAIDFSSNQVVEDSLTTNAATIDSSQIRSTGTDYLEFPGSSNAFQVLYELAADLRNDRNLDTHRLAQSLDRRLGELESIAGNAYGVMGSQASSLRTLENLGYRVDDLKLAIETQSSEVQATDLPEAVLRMENSQALLQYTYAVTAELSSLGLLQFLR